MKSLKSRLSFRRGNSARYGSCSEELELSPSSEPFHPAAYRTPVPTTRILSTRSEGNKKNKQLRKSRLFGSTKSSSHVPPPRPALSEASASLLKDAATTSDEIMPDLSPTDDIHKIIQAAQALDDAGNDLFAQGHFDDALKSYTKALKLKRRTLKFGVVEGSVQAERLLTSVATSINNIGYLRQRSGAASTEQIMAAYKDSLQIKREILGKEHISVGKTLNNIGSVHFGTNDYEQAMEAYTEAMDIMISNLGQDHLDVATILSNIGDVHLAQRELEDARHYYSSSLKIRWAQLGDHDPKVVRLLEKIAAIEMADTPQKLARLRVFDLMEHEEDDFFIDSEGRHQVGKEFQILRESVKQDVSFVDTIKRQMALEMIRDKITIIREMRRLDAGVLPEDEETSGKAITAAADHNTSASTPMTSIEREQALSNVKERIKAIRLKNGGSSRSQSEEDSSDNSIDLLETTFEDVTLYAMSSPTKLENRFEAAVSFREG